ncbi:unnamed protein product [Orchesella dallaii]|uniref:Cytochrome P450 n=1 Tax=Orchesella dallaii TaxID=48710 RepID=A0ABP1Q5D5_9HEXA
MWLALISIFILGVIAYKLFFSNSKNIFKEHSIREIDISPAVTKLDLFLARKGMAEGDSYAYKVMGSEKYCGIREMGNQMILIKDIELMKKIFIKDFEYFSDRREFFSDDEMAFKKMLPSLNGEEWKGVRTSMSPIFTTGKIRRMMEFFNLVGKEWIKSFKERSNSSSVVINVLQSANQYATDVIGYAVFGMNAGTIKNPNSPFMKQDDVEAKKGELKGEGKDELSSFEKEAQIEGNGTGEKKQWFTQQIMGYQTDVQDRLRKEVEDAEIVKEDGSIDYDDLSALVYMDMVICEVLRKFSTAGRIERHCVRDYKDSETGLFVPKGMRFALMKMKSAIAHLILNFRIVPTNKTPVPMTGKWTGLIFFPPKDLELKLIPLKKIN